MDQSKELVLYGSVVVVLTNVSSGLKKRPLFGLLCQSPLKPTLLFQETVDTPKIPEKETEAIPQEPKKMLPTDEKPIPEKEPEKMLEKDEDMILEKEPEKMLEKDEDMILEKEPEKMLEKDEDMIPEKKEHVEKAGQAPLNEKVDKGVAKEPKKRKATSDTTQKGMTKKTAAQAPDLDHDVQQLITEEPDVLLRRNQLNADFRHQAPEDEDEEDGADEDGDGDANEENQPKRKKPTKPKAKAKAKAKGKAKAKPSAKRKADKSGGSKAEKLSAESKTKKKDQKEAEKEKEEDKKDDSEKKIVKTFARRYCPGDPILAVRHRAIQAVYESEIAPKVAKQSSFQAGQF